MFVISKLPDLNLLVHAPLLGPSPWVIFLVDVSVTKKTSLITSTPDRSVLETFRPVRVSPSSQWCGHLDLSGQTSLLYFKTFAKFDWTWPVGVAQWQNTFLDHSKAMSLSSKVRLAFANSSIIVEHFPRLPKWRVWFQLPLLVPGDRKWHLTISSSTLAKHFHCHPKVEALSPASIGIGNRKWEKVRLASARGSTVVEHLPHHPKLRVSFELPLLVPVHRNWQKVTFGLAISISRVAQHFHHNPKVKDLSPATAWIGI